MLKIANKSPLFLTTALQTWGRPIYLSTDIIRRYWP